MDISKTSKVYIKESNYWAIHDFGYHNFQTILQGSKLEALYNLVKRKGMVLELKSDHEYHGVKVLEYGEGDFIGFKRTGISKENFFPCKLKTIVLREL